MIFTRDFSTKTEVIQKNNGKTDRTWEIALDLGYSGVKFFSPNAYGRFPSFAKRIDHEIEFASNIPNSVIQYRDEAGNLWVVGDFAYSYLKPGDTSDSDSSLFGRERYTQPMFMVIAETALGLTTMSNGVSRPTVNDRYVIQTGLPERYLNDSDELKDALSGTHHFSVKLGPRAWQDFSININRNDVFVMSQPKGTLFSVCINGDGSASSKAKEYLSSSGLVFDAGFGTLDIFPIHNGAVGEGETFSDLGMRRVMQDTVTRINELYHESLTVPQLQKTLPQGKIRHVDMKSFAAKEYDYASILEEENKKVCYEAIDRLAGSIPLVEYNYMIITGGTGEAWFDLIKDRFKDFTTLELVKGNMNDNLPMVYANTRGYYFYCYNKLQRGKR